MRATYLFHEMWQNMKSNKIPNMIAIATIAIALSIFGLFLLFLINFQSIIDSFEEKVNVVLYLKDSSTQKDIEKIRDYLSLKKEIDSIAYISKQKALEEFKIRMGEHRAILEGLDTNPLPSSFVIKFKKDFKDSLFIKGFIENAKKLRGVESIEYGKDWVEKFEIFTWLIKIITLVIGGLLGLASILIIYNTIKLTAYSRREEIEIMRLVGATRSFIKGPFILEGMIQGVLGAALSIMILWIFYKTFIVQITAPIGSFLGLAKISFFDPSLILTIIFISLILGTLGSYFALGRILKI